MQVYGGTVRNAAQQLEQARTRGEFVANCARRFHHLHGKPVGEAERTSWLKSWPELASALMTAGLGELWLGLEYQLHGSGERVDALLLGADPEDRLVAVVVELKQWSACEFFPHDPLQLVAYGRECLHPSVQAAGYVDYLDKWVRRAELEMLVRGVALLHNAPPALVNQLRAALSSVPTSGHIPIVGAEELRTSQPLALRELMGCGDLATPSPEQVQRFLAARHAAPMSLFDELNALLKGTPRFTVIGEQQRAYRALMRAFDLAWQDRTRHFIGVTGGPGTGKTVIAMRLLAALPRRARQLDVQCEAKYLTPSGTLRWQLERAAGGGVTKGLFANVDNYADSPLQGPEVIVVDEAQRVQDAEVTIAKLLRKSNTGVFFLDERQIIRPNEGLTIAQLEKLAEDSKALFTHIDLDSQFRCGGSQRYQNWLNDLLSLHPVTHPWDSEDYDVSAAPSPVHLQAWIDQHTAGGKVDRIAAGFCWPWNHKRPEQSPLLDEVTIPWTDPVTGQHNTWARPWNAPHALKDKNGNPIAPKSPGWATDPGGHNQIGCIYTSQGLEYPYSGVIIGPDLVWRGERWHADPRRSKDRAMKKLSAEQYLPLALNIYRVLLSRGSAGCRVYSTDPETQTLLTRLLPAATG
ncbi:DNA/RNA helicase domain-containing protein [Kutzneria albida]|uniref:AAA+ ATPase domain-containing protein n=1 Tax=Kutzneria albida DSM 43870 TaxID=1449976 RepID=W5WBM9_9PSEU|nr:DNA/RNA helicase domain-containing protein [Kutzneria albida]AHH98583.1 hypothetical protein KALB_5221 [Kutzneria albida DSM 43870]